MCVLFETSDWLSIFNTVVTGLIGMWVALIVQRRSSNNRAIKDYFINEAKELKITYIDFINTVINNKISSREIKNRLKGLSERISCFTKSINETFDIRAEKMNRFNVEVQTKITSSVEFNDNYEKAFLILSEDTRKKVLKSYENLLKVFSDTVIDINQAHDCNKNHKRKHKH